jgi:hypothetical protein
MIMKRPDKKSDRNFDEIISKFSETEILDPNALRCIRGGGADGNGSEPILIPPPPPEN